MGERFRSPPFPLCGVIDHDDETRTPCEEYGVVDRDFLDRGFCRRHAAVYDRDGCVEVGPLATVDRPGDSR